MTTVFLASLYLTITGIIALGILTLVRRRFPNGYLLLWPTFVFLTYVSGAVFVFMMFRFVIEWMAS